MNIERAEELARNLFEGVVDLQGNPYEGHLSRVVEYLPAGIMDEVIMAAWLHDVIEDTDVEEDDLLGMGFSELVVGGVMAVSKKDGESYADFVVQASKHPIGKLVKIADLMDNSSPDRVLIRPGSEERDRKRHEKYELSKRFLFDELSEAEYRELMSDLLGK